MSDVLHFRAEELRRGDHVVMRDVELSLERDGFHCIIGANGTGKSTLLKAMCGDLMDGVDELIIDGQQAHGLDVTKLATLRAVLPQTLAPRFPYAVRDVVAWGAYSRGGVDDIEVEAVLARLEISALIDRPVTLLSGGEWARVRIAQAMIQKPAVLFADEPDAALDRRARHALFSMLAASPQTVVVVTHDVELARRYSTHVIGLKDGRIAFQRPAAEVTGRDCGALWV